MSCWDKDDASKENLHLHDQSKQVFYILLWCFLREKENMFSMFLLSYNNTHERLGELKKLWKHLLVGSCSHNIPLSPKLPLVFLWLNKIMEHVFSFFNGNRHPWLACKEKKLVCNSLGQVDLGENIVKKVMN